MTDRRPPRNLFDFPTGHQGLPGGDAGDGVGGEQRRSDTDPSEHQEPSGRREIADSVSRKRSLQRGLFEGDALAGEALGDAPTQRPSEIVQQAPTAAMPEASSLDADVGPEPQDGGVAAGGIAARWLGGAADVLLQTTVLILAVGAMVQMGLPASVRLWPGYAVFMLAFSFLYVTLPLAFWGKTPGMAWRGLRAQNQDGLSLTFSQTVLRWFAALLTVGLLGVPLLLAFSGRSLADRLSDSRTVVVDGA